MGDIKIGRMVLGGCQTNCYFLYRDGEHEAIVVDPADQGGNIYAALQKNGFRVAGILLTHGHYYNVSLGVEGLYQEAVDRNCDIAMYGHTHRPFLEKRGAVTILNPGSLSYPRQEGRKPSYMLMYVKEDGSVSYDQHFLS